MVPPPAFPFHWAEHCARVDASRALIRRFPSGSVVAYSAGKDSTVLAHLVASAGLTSPLIYHVTTIDPPELVRFARQSGAWFDHPGTSYPREIRSQGLPTMWRRWCCRTLKHGRSFADVTFVGIRAQESHRRAARWKPVQTNSRTTVVAPLLDWSAEDVWAYIHDNRLPYCRLYDEGHKRLGCIGCPVARGSRLRDFPRWPKLAAHIHAAHQDYYASHGLSSKADKFWHDWTHDHFVRPAAADPCAPELDLWA